jgi:outer membrane protein TolC
LAALACPAADPSAPPATAPVPAPNADPAPLPIDLPTVLRLADADNPTVALARARVAEAYARVQLANAYFLPTLRSGATYQRTDGPVQDTIGNIITTSKSNLFAGGQASLSFDVADALFLPLIARRLAQAEAANARATANNVQLDAALVYLDLLQNDAAQAINADTLAKAEEVLRLAQAADAAGLSKTKADVNRARTDVELRRQAQIDLEGQAAVISARLAQLLLLQPTVDLRPADPAVLPITLVPVNGPLEELVGVGLMNRPELAANRALVAAAVARLRQARAEPFVPKIQLDYRGGTFGGGINERIGDFGGRGDGTAAAYWELRGLGFANRAEARVRQAQLDQTNYRVTEVSAQVAAEVTAAAKQTRARLRPLESAQEAVRQATEMYRRLREASFGMAGPRGQYDAIEPLLAIQALAQARTQYLTEVIEYDRAQLRLYTALGRPPLCALPGIPEPLQVPVKPPAPEPLPPPRPLAPPEPRR